MKPTIFIGSSSEQKVIAEAIEKLLKPDFETHLWTNAFDLSKFTLENLIKELDNTNYAVFVMGADDVTKMRGEEYNTVRDNVIFELGLFIGRHGRERVFYVVPTGTDVNNHLPTDLDGLTYGTYDSLNTNLEVALKSFCEKVKKQVNETFLPLIPKQGFYEKNILYKNDEEKLIRGKNYSMSAKTPINFTLLVRLTAIDPADSKIHWFFGIGTEGDWKNRSYEGNTQEFTLKAKAEADLMIHFLEVKKVMVELFKYGEEKPYSSHDLIFE